MNGIVSTALILTAGFMIATEARSTGDTPPTGSDGEFNISVEFQKARPRMAATPDELSRLRAAYEGAGRAHDLVAARIEAAENVLRQPIEFPPRGGQHNQWYQCDKCQMGLVTVDDTHHKCPKCGTVYSGPPYDDVIFSRKHGRNMANARTTAWAYAVTEDERFARYTADVLLGYAERYLEYPYHDAHLGKGGTGGGHILEQTLSEASMCAVNTAPAYDLIYESDVLSATDHRKIRDGLIVPMLESIDRNKRGISNWQTWHNAAFITAGAVIGDASWVRKAIEQEGNGFLFQMEKSVSDEGMWYENSWGYHFYTLRAMTIITETAERLGIDLWSQPKLKPMYTLPVSYVMADGSLPRFGDDVNTTLEKHADLFETAYLAYEDPAFLPYLPSGPTWQSIMSGREPGPSDSSADVSAPGFLGSAVFETAGHAILRTKGEAGLTAALTFSPYGGFHGHLDKLSFVFFGYGKELGVDPGRAKSQAYRLPIHNEWYRSTISHNAVLVDGKSQEPAAGFLECFATNGDYAGVVTGCTEAYPRVTHRRMLLLTPSYLLVFDEVRSSSGERRFDWVYHNRGEGVSLSFGEEPLEPDSEVEGMQYVHGTRGGESSGSVHATVQEDDGYTVITIAGAEDTHVLIGNGPCASVEDRVPMIVATRYGSGTNFAAVLEPVSGDGTRSVRSVRHTSSDGKDVITVSRKDGSETVTLASDGGFVVRSGEEKVLTGRP